MFLGASMVLVLSAAAAVIEPRSPAPSRPAPAEVLPAQLEAQARDIFERLRPLFPTRGPRPNLEVSRSDRVDAQADAAAIITVTSGLLKLCARQPAGGRQPDAVTGSRIAFVLSHELAHVTHGHPGLFGPGVARAIEERADADAVGALFVAGFDADQLHLQPLLDRIAAAKKVSDPTVPRRVGQVAASIRLAQRDASEWRIGWLLSVSGRFEDARAFYRSFASKYPLPSALGAHAHARMLAAWRLHPCSDPQVLRWSVPLRFDPRAQAAPFTVRSSDDPCPAFTAEVREVIEELANVPAYPPAHVARGALRLMLGDPSLDATSKDGGVSQVGAACPPPPPDAEARLLHADACQISLLAQYEIGARSPAALGAATDGLRALRGLWPDEPSLQFNLARLLTHAGKAQEAEPLWREFARHAADGPYREEALAELRRFAPSPATPLTPEEPEGGAPAAGASGALDVLAPPCAKPESGVAVSTTPQRHLRRCGSWSDEFVVKDTRGVLIRSVSATSKLWPAGVPPSSTPLFVSNDATGDVVRVWDREAWVFKDGAPTRVVHFRPR